MNEEKYLKNFKTPQEIIHAPEFINQIEYNQLNKQINQLLDRLTPRQKEIFLLSRRNHLTHKEIAKQLNLSVNTVKSHITSALSFLKKNMKNDLTQLLFFYLFL
jgi:RNA polymerase sigma-70 factor (ECF subfamily)